MRSEKEIKDLKNYAIALIRSGWHLLDLIDRIEKECTDESVPPDLASKTYTKYEDKLRDALMESIEPYNAMFQTKKMSKAEMMKRKIKLDAARRKRINGH